jgi:hypothetical protein
LVQPAASSYTTFDRSGHRAPHWSIKISRLLPWTIGLGLPVEQFGINAVLFNQTIEPVAPSPATLFALDAQHLELADQVQKMMSPSPGISPT